MTIWGWGREHATYRLLSTDADEDVDTDIVHRRSIASAYRGDTLHLLCSWIALTLYTPVVVLYFTPPEKFWDGFANFHPVQQRVTITHLRRGDLLSCSRFVKEIDTCSIFFCLLRIASARQRDGATAMCVAVRVFRNQRCSRSGGMCFSGAQQTRKVSRNHEGEVSCGFYVGLSAQNGDRSAERQAGYTVPYGTCCSPAVQNCIPRLQQRS